jgi:hypothetical protein
MGWSAASKACETLDRFTAWCVSQTGSQNRYEQGGEHRFLETGREQTDGAIVGSAWNLEGKRRGRFRIEPDGTVIDGPLALKQFSA